MSSRDAFLGSCKLVCDQKGWSFSPGRIDVPQPEGRSQRVLFEFFDFEGQQLVRLHAQIGSVLRIEPLRLTNALDLNFRLPHGALAVHDETLVLVDTMMVEEADPEEIAAAFGYLAETGDHLERTMFGPDVH